MKRKEGQLATERDAWRVLACILLAVFHRMNVCSWAGEVSTDMGRAGEKERVGAFVLNLCENG